MAAVDYFLKLDGIPGESTDSKHKNEIDVTDWSWGQTNTGTHGGGSGGGAGKVNIQDFNFTMKINKASPKLFLACATGQHIKDGLLICRRAGKEQQEYLKITFTDVLVSNHQTGGSEGESVVPTDRISLNFGKIEISYAPQKADGSLDTPVVHHYSPKTNKGG